MRAFHLLPHLTALACAALNYKTFDISSLLLEEAKSVKYYNTAGKEQTLEWQLKEAGANSIKIRLWVDPPDGSYNLDYGLRLGQRVKDAGMKLILNLHYSDTWADPGHQDIPARWRSLSFDGLVRQVESYTKDVVNAFVDKGITVDMITIGNEIRAGFLWPHGKYDNFGNMAKLLAAGVSGVRGSRSAGTKIMIHLDRGYDWGTQEWWYNSITAAGFSLNTVDVLGISYYPFYDASKSTLENFRTSATNLVNKYKKPLVVAETDWPVRCSRGASLIPASLRSIGFSEDGQIDWIRRIADVVKSLPSGLGWGIMYWEPGWINNQGLGSGCEENTLFAGRWGSGWAAADARKSVRMMADL